MKGLGLLLAAFVFFMAKQREDAVRKEHEEKMQQLMDHDPLTGLLNMNGFRKRVEELLRANPDKPYFLSYNNIRDFKFINDSLGNAAITARAEHRLCGFITIDRL